MHFSLSLTTVSSELELVLMPQFWFCDPNGPYFYEEQMLLNREIGISVSNNSSNSRLTKLELK